MSSTKEKVSRWLKILSNIKDIWIMTGITLILLVILDVILGVFTGIIDKPQISIKTEREMCGTVPWCSQYYKDHNNSVKLQWIPYVYWRREPFTSQYINVDKKGIRKTWNDFSGNKPYKIFMFGGSTMWGSGARDEYTIPSYIAKRLNKEIKRPIEVINFGETGYVSNQEIFTLIRELQQGNIPDLVIFYDGVNDVYASFQSGKAGIPMNETNRDLGMKLVLDNNELYKRTFSLLLDNSGIYKFARFVRYSLMKQSMPVIKNDSESLAEETASSYQAGIGIVDELSAKYGFKTVYFWQPVVFFKGSLTDYEKSEAQKEDSAKNLYIKVYDLIDKSTVLNKKSNFYNISEIFKFNNNEVFTDFCHITEDSNKLVADEIYKNIIDYVKSGNKK